MKLMKRNNDILPAMWDSFAHDDWFTMPGKFKTRTNVPAINILDNDNDFLIELVVPGMNKSDFKIDVENDLLTISAEERKEDQTKEANYTRREFYYTAFNRSFNLPETVDSDKIQATYTDGVLGISIPKKEEAKPKPSIKIQIA